MTFDISLYAFIGFLFAAYAVVANDALQTLGTFIRSNRHVHWFALYAFAAAVLIIVFVYGWYVNGGDPSYGRLANTSKYPPMDVQWYHVLPPLVLLVITRFGMPVSTSFMILTIFATGSGLQSMITKSLMGYGVAFAVGAVLYVVLAPTLERFFKKTEDKANQPIWVLLQWSATGYLWAVWLMQDFANIFVFLPRQLSAFEVFGAMALMAALLGITFANHGGPVQKILNTKTAVTDIRSATIIDLTYATLLFYFKEINNIPMSTTWVFLGLIAGRELAIATLDKVRTPGETFKIIFSDAGKAFFGLVVSVVLAVGLPWIAQQAGQ